MRMIKELATSWGEMKLPIVISITFKAV